MSRASCQFCLYAFCAIATFALAQNHRSSKIEVLYLAETLPDQHVLLTTFNVNPDTAIARLAGEPLVIESPRITPLTVEKKHVIYVWNESEIWMYRTDWSGVPQRQPSQRLRFNLPQPVNTFLADPDGKFAYAATVWTDSKGEDVAAIFLLTIDNTGMLTNTHTLVGRWGPILYWPLTGFYFGTSGKNLYATEYDYEPPVECSPGVLYYPVDPKTGGLGIFPTTWFQLGAGCSSTWAIAADDTLGGFAINSGGPGNGVVEISSFQGFVLCEPRMLAFCGDTPTTISFDPADQNLFYGDADTKETYVGHIDFVPSSSRVQGRLLGTPTSIPGTPPIVFSPDSTLIYAENACDIGIYTFQSSTGDLGTTTSITDSCNVAVATTTLEP